MTAKNTKPKCGIIMPISQIGSYSAEHWSEVLSILKDTIKDCDFEPNLVSDADDIGIIQKRIIQNIYSNEIIVCDVSAKNSNVMFELGMRLAFDKPTIIIKDSKTDFSFDTSIIEHLMYPSDLRFSQINIFKEKLAEKIRATYDKSVNDSHYSTFLKSFGQYKIAKLEEKEVTSEAFILKSLDELKSQINQLSYQNQDNLYRENILNKKDTLDRLSEKFIADNSIKETLSSKLIFIKYLQEYTGLGLKELKDYADDYFIILEEQLKEVN
ncbi:MAG: RNA helicase [Bacteroidales bacterium]|nr:RNA helicase [Bacteroidales bacterium]